MDFLKNRNFYAKIGWEKRDKKVILEDNDLIKREDIVKSTKKKTTAEKYSKEKKEFIDEPEKIMGLTESKRDVLLYDLENNDKLKKIFKR